MLDLVHLAIQTDSTRLITMLLLGTSLVPPIQGVAMGHHDLSHHGQDPKKIEQLRIVELEEMKALREFLEKLKKTEEQGESLLDRTMVFFSSNLGNAANHSTKNLPVVRLGAYSATKHAVLGMSDALRMDLVPYGIGVSVLCPGGVNTNISQTLTRLSSDHPQADLNADLQAFMVGNDEATNTVIEPERVAELVLRGVREDRPYIITAPGAKPHVARRFEQILEAHDHARAIDPTLP